MKTVKDIFYFVEDVMTITGLSRSKSYKIIADLNRELSDRGYCQIRASAFQQRRRRTLPHPGYHSDLPHRRQHP